MHEVCPKLAKRLLQFFDGLYREELYSVMEHISIAEINHMLDLFPPRLTNEFFNLFHCTSQNSAYYPSETCFKLTSYPFTEVDHFQEMADPQKKLALFKECLPTGGP